MNHPRLLTIRNVTMPMCEWARRPGAASYAAICKRVTKYGWDDERAVFAPSQPGKPGRMDGRRSAPRRSVCHGATVAPPPAPYTPPPFRPTIGRFRSFPLSALETLRRVA